MSLMAFLVGSFMTEDFRLTTSETHKWPLLHQVLDDRQLDCMPTQKHGNLSCIQYWMTEGLSPCHMVTFLAWSTGWQKVWVHAKAKAWWPMLLTPRNGWLRPGCKPGGLSCAVSWRWEGWTDTPTLPLPGLWTGRASPHSGCWGCWGCCKVAPAFGVEGWFPLQPGSAWRWPFPEASSHSERNRNSP